MATQYDLKNEWMKLYGSVGQINWEMASNN